MFCWNCWCCPWSEEQGGLRPLCKISVALGQEKKKGKFSRASFLSLCHTMAYLSFRQHYFLEVQQGKISSYRTAEDCLISIKSSCTDLAKHLGCTYRKARQWVHPGVCHWDFPGLILAISAPPPKYPWSGKLREGQNMLHFFSLVGFFEL